MSRSAPVITIYKNGDNHFLGKKLVVNRRHYRSFDNFLDKVTEDTRAGVAIRKIHTPQHGTKVGSLEKIENGAIYVAAGPERFKRIPYDKIGENMSPKSTPSPVRPVFHSKITASSRYKKEAMAEPLRNRIIFVHRNGEERTPPMKLLLDKRTLKEMDSVLQYISNKINLTAGAVKSLHCLETGAKVTDVNEINTNMFYVAVGSGKHFVKGRYSNDNNDKFTSPKQKINKSKSKELKKTDELRPVVTGLVQEVDVKSPIDNGILSSLEKEKSDSNFMDELLDSANETLENNTNHIDEIISDASEVITSPAVSPVANGHPNPVPSAASPVSNKSETNQNNNSSPISGDNDAIDIDNAPLPMKPIVHKHEKQVTEVTGSEESSKPDETNDPINVSIEPVTESIDDLSGTPDALNITSDGPILDSLENDLSGTPEVNDSVNTSDKANTDIENDRSDTTDINNSIGISINVNTETNEQSVDVPEEENVVINEDHDNINESVNNNLLNSSPAPEVVNEAGDVGDSELSVYKASGKQQESGLAVKDDKETAVEELIDKIPAAEVEEELEAGEVIKE